MPPLVSVQAFLRVFAWAGHGRAGPWALAPGRRVAGKEAGPFAGRRHRGQLYCVGASSLALCSLRAWSQTAPLFSCWDCWEVGRPDWGVWAGGRDTRCQALTGPVSMLLQVRPGIKVQLGSGPSRVGLAGGGIPGGGIPLGLWAAPRQQVMLVYTCIPTLPWGGFGRLPPWLLLTLPSSAGPRGGPLRSVPPVLSALCSRISAPPLPCSAATCAHGLCFSPHHSGLPAGSVPRGLYLPLPAAVSLLPPPSVPLRLPPCLSPSAPVAPSSLGSISKSVWLRVPLPVLAWSPCPCVPGSLCVGGDGGVSREESVGFSTPAAGRLSW